MKPSTSALLGGRDAGGAVEATNRRGGPGRPRIDGKASIDLFGLEDHDFEKATDGQIIFT